MTLEELQAEVEKLNKIIAKKDAVIQQQNVQIENMLQAILHARKERFGAKSEATLPGQFSCSRMNSRKHWRGHWKNRKRKWLSRIKSLPWQRNPVSAVISWQVFRWR